MAVGLGNALPMTAAACCRAEVDDGLAGRARESAGASAVILINSWLLARSTICARVWRAGVDDRAAVAALVACVACAFHASGDRRARPMVGARRWSAEVDDVLASAAVIPRPAHTFAICYIAEPAVLAWSVGNKRVVRKEVSLIRETVYERITSRAVEAAWAAASRVGTGAALCNDFSDFQVRQKRFHAALQEIETAR